MRVANVTSPPRVLPLSDGTRLVRGEQADIVATDHERALVQAGHLADLGGTGGEPTREDLVDQARELGVAVSGTKAQLQERIDDARAEQARQTIPNPGEEPAA